MAAALKSLVSSVLGGGGGESGSGSGSGSGSRKAASQSELFARTDPATDGDECLRDCDTCTVRYPRSFKIDEEEAVYGRVEGWSTHAVVATGKTDWLRDVADEKGSVMEAIARAEAPSNGRLMVSASDMVVDGDGDDEYARPTTVLLLPAFALVQGVHARNVPVLLRDVVSRAPTTETPLQQQQQQQQQRCDDDGAALLAASGLRTESCPHRAVVLLCSQRTRDARCGQSAPLLRRELERHLRPLGLHRDPHDRRPGGVAIYFVSHVGGHRYSANVLIYRRPDAFGLDHVPPSSAQTPSPSPSPADDARPVPDVGAAQCIWLARIRPEHCENLVRYTILRGKVVSPESQLRGGFDRARGLTSW